MPEKRTVKRCVSPGGAGSDKATHTTSSRHSFQSIPWEHLSLVPSSEGFLPGLKRLALFLKDISKADAIGIRLQEGPDFPFFFSRGFTRGFVQAENHLCRLDDQGNFACDKLGNPMLECMCGFVLRCRARRQRLGFSRRGSFLSTSREEFLRILESLGEILPLHGRCHAEGFETIGLVPLRRGSRTFGLLQFNWRQAGAITWEKFLFLEQAAENAAWSLTLQESHEKLKARVHDHHQSEERHGECVARLLPDGTITYANPALGEALGGGRIPMLGQNLFERCFKGDRRKLQVVLQGLTAQNPSRQIEFRIPDGGGLRWFQLQGTGAFDAQGKLKEILAHGRDITHHRRLEKGLRETLQMLDGVFRKSPLPIIALDRHGLVMLWNPSAERIFGHQAEEMVGAVLPFSDPEGEKKFFGSWQDMLDDGTVRSMPVQLKSSEGRLLDVVISTGILRDEKNRPAGGVCICWDFDEATRPRIRRDKWESQLVRIQRMEALGRLAGGIAHDFNSQLTTITGYCEMLLEELPKGSSSRGWVGEILVAASKSAGLTEKMLAFSRAQVLKPELVQWNNLLQSLERTFLRTLPERIQRQLILAPDLGLAFSDPSQCEQTLLHLALNAVDAMPHDGKLRIETRNEIVYLPQPSIHGMILPGSYVVVSVNDSGNGIEESLQEKIFEPFFTTKSVGQGTGLGLSMVLGFMQQSGGNVLLRSAPDQGTRVDLYFPLVASDQVERLKIARVVTSDSVIETVLLAIGDDLNRDRLLQRLRGQGYRAMSVSRGDLAVEFCRKFRESIRAILLDGRLLQGGEGAGIFQGLTRDHPEARIVILSPENVKDVGSSSWPGLPARQLIPHSSTDEEIVQRLEELLEP